MLDLEEFSSKATVLKMVASHSHYLTNGCQLAGPALNQNTNGEAFAQWRRGSPNIVVIDDFLTNEALDSLRRFCWGSTVWRGVYDAGYLGAFPTFGFACPLLAQIAD